MAGALRRHGKWRRGAGGGSGPRCREHGGRRDRDGSAPDEVAMAAVFVGRWRCPPSHAPVTRTPARRPRLREDKERPCGSGSFLNCHASREKTAEKKTKTHKALRSGCEMHSDHYVLYAKLYVPCLPTCCPPSTRCSPQQPQWPRLNPLGEGGLDPPGVC